MPQIIAKFSEGEMVQTMALPFLGWQGKIVTRLEQGGNWVYGLMFFAQRINQMADGTESIVEIQVFPAPLFFLEAHLMPMPRKLEKGNA